MDESTAQLITNIKALSPVNQAKIANYVAFLQWLEDKKTEQFTPNWSFSFIEQFNTATIQATQDEAGMDVQLSMAQVGDETRPALWAHPPLIGQTVIEYHVPIPEQLQTVRLRTEFGIRDGAQINPDNLVAFSIWVNGLRVWGEQTAEKRWRMVNVPLDLPTGDLSRIAFATETLGSHEWTWAVWGQPELYGVLK